MKEIKVMQNDVSLFIAGFKAAMVYFGGLSQKEIENEFYTSLRYPNITRECYRDYTSEETDTDGTKAMYSGIFKRVRPLPSMAEIESAFVNGKITRHTKHR